MAKKNLCAEDYDLMTVNEVAARAKIGAKSVWRAIDRLEIAVTRLGGCARISEAAYREWIRRSTHDAAL